MSEISMIISDGSLTRQTIEFIDSLDDTPSDDLLQRLGCLTCMDNDGCEWVISPFPLSPPEDMEELRSCQSLLLSGLIRKDMMGSPSFGPLLSGLLWQASSAGVSTEQQCYDLAALSLVFIEKYFKGSKLDRKVGSDLCDFLTTWLKPDVPWKELPWIGEAARAMFGTAWCDLSLPETIGTDAPRIRILPGSHVVGATVYTERPPFLPGLCPAQDAIPSAPLPHDMGWSA
jgi:hypothetical protein